MARNKHHYTNLLNNGGGSFGDRMWSAVLGTVGDRRFTERSNIPDECVDDLTAGVGDTCCKGFHWRRSPSGFTAFLVTALLASFDAPWWANLYTVVSSSLPQKSTSCFCGPSFKQIQSNRIDKIILSIFINYINWKLRKKSIPVLTQRIQKINLHEKNHNFNMA